MPETYEPFPAFAEWRGLPVDEDTFDRFVGLLEDAREKATPEAVDRALTIGKRYAAMDTGAIEGLYATDRGFTRTVAVEAAAWEKLADERDPHIRPHFEDQLAAYDWVLDMATRARPLTEVAIKEIHAILCRSQQTYRVHTAVGIQERPLAPGAYKTEPNNPTRQATGEVYHYAPPDLVPAEMHRLVKEVGSVDFADAHCVLQAAYLHYAFVRIHPFPDGNGRVSRALASMPLVRRLSLPFFMFADQREEYLDALEATDSGDPTRFVSFVAQRVYDLVGIVRLSLVTPASAPVTTTLTELRRLLTARGGLSQAEMTALASRLTDVLDHALQEKADRLRVPEGIHVSANTVRQAIGGDPNFVVGSGPPVQTQAGFSVSVHVGTTRGDPGFRVISSRDPERTLDVEVTDIDPIISEKARLRLDLWLGGEIEASLEDLRTRMEDALRAQGYEV